MLEASAVATAIPSLWSAVNSWFTPAVLFLLLNLMIATIALTSSLNPPTPPSHDIHPYPHELHQQQQQHDGEAAAGQSPSISILDRVKSLGFFSSSTGKSSSPQRRQPIPLIPPEELYSETHDPPKDPYEKQGLGQPGSPSPVGKFEAFDLYGYLPGEPTSEIPSNPAHYIFEPTLPQEVLVPAEQNEKAEEEVGEEEDVAIEEKEEDEEEEEEVVVEEETGVKDGSEEERETTETEVPGLLLHRGIRRSESLNVKFSFSNVGEEEGGGHEEGEVTESVEKRRPATAREGKGKWGGDEEVDARADDFINRFKQQLKLQRMDSHARQKDVTMIGKVRSF